MTILSEDDRMIVDVGGFDIWNSLYSTVITRLAHMKSEIVLAIAFLESGTCLPSNCIETARELNLIRDALSQIPPSEAVYDHKKPALKAPWLSNISPIITSCGNLFTTADGKDLISELNTVLCYCSIKKIPVVTQ